MKTTDVKFMRGSSNLDLNQNKTADLFPCSLHAPGDFLRYEAQLLLRHGNPVNSDNLELCPSPRDDKEV